MRSMTEGFRLRKKVPVLPINYNDLFSIGHVIGGNPAPFAVT